MISGSLRLCDLGLLSPFPLVREKIILRVAELLLHNPVFESPHQLPILPQLIRAGKLQPWSRLLHLPQKSLLLGPVLPVSEPLVLTEKAVVWGEVLHLNLNGDVKMWKMPKN